MKVLLACMPGGGSATYSEVLARGLAAQGIQATILTVGTDDRLRRDSVGGLPRLSGRLGNAHWYLRRLLPLTSPVSGVVRGYELAILFDRLARVATNDGAILDVFEGPNFTRGQHKRWPICVSLHSSAFTWKENLGAGLTLQDKLDKRAERSQLQRASAIHSASARVAAQLQTSLRVSLPRLDVFPYLVDQRLFSIPLRADKASSEIRVLHVGRPDAKKGAQLLCDAIPGVLAAAPLCVFEFIGWSSADPLARSFVSRLSPSEASRLRLRGMVTYDELLMRYDWADICVIPSLWDCSPFAVYEAMARGCAVVASDVGGIPELVADGDGGLLVPPGDSKAVAAAIAALATDRSFLRDQQRRSRERALELFDPSIIIKRQLAYFRDAWERHTGRR